VWRPWMVGGKFFVDCGLAGSGQDVNGPWSGAINKKMVPSDPISQPNSPPACLARSFAARIAGLLSFPLPATWLKATAQRFQAHRQAFLAGTGVSQRPFALPERLPVSGPPFRGRSSRPATSTPCRARVLLVRLSAPLHASVCPGTRKITAKNPLPDLRPTLSTVLRIFTPLRGFSVPSGSTLNPIPG
jgi:hypothetical protein